MGKLRNKMTKTTVSEYSNLHSHGFEVINQIDCELS